MKRVSNISQKNKKSESGNAVLKYSYLLLIIIPLVLFIPSLRNGYVYFDDDILILDNQAKITNPDNFLKTFKTDAFFNNTSPYYRPMLNVSLMLDSQVAGTKPGFYHFMNLLYHILCCITLLWLLQLLGLSREKAFAGSVIFSIHPLMASAVFWIPARNDLLVTLFGLLFLSLSIIWFRQRKPLLLLASIFSFALALFSKESGILLPVLLIIYLFSTKQLTWDKRTAMLFSGIVLITIGWFILRTTSISRVGTWQLGLWAIWANFPFPFEIIAKFFLPFNLAVTPVYTSLYTGIGILISILILGFFLISKEKVVWLFVFGIIWYVAFSLPNMFVRLDTSADNYDYLVHRSYLPLAGLLISLLVIIPERWVKLNLRINIAWLTIVMITLAINSMFLGTRYKDANSFWGSSIVYKPGKAWFHYFLGRSYFKQQDYPSFEYHLRKAISIKKHPRFLYHLGMIYFVDKKSYDSAFLLFNEARALGFTEPEGNANYVKLCVETARRFFEQAQYKKAVERSQLAVTLDPLNSIAIYNLGLYMVYCGEEKKAAPLWRRSLVIDPELKEAYRSLYFYYLNNTTNRDSIEYFAREFRKRGGVL